MNNKIIFKMTLIFFVGFSALNILMWMSGYAYGFFSYGDLYNQHLLYMNYFQKNFYESYDLIPDLNMHFGMVQNLANMYYYGVFNPFIRLFVLFPYLTVFQYQMLLIILVYTLIFHFSLRLLNRLQFNISLVIFGAFIITLYPAFMYFYSHHIMYGYPYLFLIIGFYGLISIIKEKKIIWFVIANIGIIATNLFTFQATSLYFLIFYVYLVLLYKANITTIKNSLSKVFISYLFSLGIGMIVILPQVHLFISGSRYSLNEMALPLMINLRTSSEFMELFQQMGIGFFSTFVLVSFIFTKKRYIIIPTILLIIIFISKDINYVFNLFALQNKIYIYTGPLITILLLSIISEMTTLRENALNISSRRIKVLLMVSVAVFMFYALYGNESVLNLLINSSYYNSYMIDDVYRVIAFYVLTSVSVIILVFTLGIYNFEICNKRKRIVLGLLVFIYVIFSISLNSVFARKSSLEQYTNIIRVTNQSDYGLYRQNPSNYSEAKSTNLGLNSVNNYTSFINPYYLDYFNSKVDLPVLSSGVAIHRYSGSKIINKVLSVESGSSFNVKPFIYGSYNAIDLSDWMAVDRPLRFVASLEGPSVEGSYFETTPIKFDSANYLVYSIDEIAVKSTEDYELDFLERKNGEYIFVADVETSDYLKISINNIDNVKSPSNSRYYNHNEQLTFYIPSNSEDFKLVTTSDTILRNVKIFHISDKEIEELESSYVEPYKLEVDLNDSFTFNMDMKEKGLLATTIPYDKGYTIYVDGEEVELILIDDSFIGAKLTKGNHKIEIKYKTPLKREGAILTILFTLGLIVYLKRARTKITHVVN